ncbi:MAG: acylphosphatase [Actinomycetota bacterium]
MNDSEPVRAHIWVSGRVQGVFFRQQTVDKARSAGLAGWVRNTQDGSVEAVFEGAADGVGRLIEWCRRGPERAQVSNVEVDWEEPRGEESFRVRP